MSKLDNALQEHMAFIVFHEKRPFSYKDFLKFELGGKIYGMKHGTFRNKITKLRKKGEVERLYYSPQAFYTLKGHKFGKPVTPDHTVVYNNSILQMLQILPLEKQSIHNIRLNFRVPQIWKILSSSQKLQKNKRSQDIVIPSWKNNNTIVRTIIHKTDTVSVIVGCSLEPIILEQDGFTRLLSFGQS
jgi:hypothetical protein